MHFSRIIPLLFLMVVSAVAAPKKIEIPEASWTKYDFYSIDVLSAAANWTPLRGVDVPNGSIEVRVWISPYAGPWQGIRLCRDGDRWTGFYTRQAFGGGFPFRCNEAKPRADWAGLWQKVEGLGILTLPDSASLESFKTRVDENGVTHSEMSFETQVYDAGASYVVEINDGERYRTYKYNNPDYQKWPEAKRFDEIIKTLRGELLLAPKIEIPRAGWVDVFFGSINALSKKAGWTPLREVNLPIWSYEVRVWIGFGRAPLQGLRLCCDGYKWTGFYAREGRGENYPFSAREVQPRTDWGTLWQKVSRLGIFTLPDSSVVEAAALARLGGQGRLDAIRREVADGVCYVVEINDGNYRTYEYSNPQSQEWPEAKKIIEVIKVLEEELLQPLKKE